MPLLVRIYYNAVFGALGGLLGWMLFGVFGEKNANYSEPVFLSLSRGNLNDLLGGAIIGGCIGYFVVSVEAIRDRAVVKFARLASYGVCLAVIGGAIGNSAGEWVNRNINQLGDNVFLEILARGLGWSLLGVAIGMSEGIAARSLGRFSYGTLGGAIGGFVGGGLFILLYKSAVREGTTSYFGSAAGLVILGACIGSLSALVQGVFQPACVRVLRGWQEGREYPLEKPASLLGRDEHADIAFFRDMKIEKRHAFIRRFGEQYVLVNNNAPAEFTRVNDVPVAQPQELQDGDRIQLGNVVLRFHLRAALANRLKAKKLAPSH